MNEVSGVGKRLAWVDVIFGCRHAVELGLLQHCFVLEGLYHFKPIQLNSTIIHFYKRFHFTFLQRNRLYVLNELGERQLT
jgi:hypothetical protein